MLALRLWFICGHVWSCHTTAIVSPTFPRLSRDTRGLICRYVWRVHEARSIADGQRGIHFLALEDALPS